MVPVEEARGEVTRHIQELCVSARISADPVVLVSNNPSKAIQHVSSIAAIVLLGMDPPDEGTEQKFFERMESFAGNLPRVLMVNNAGGMELES